MTRHTPSKTKRELEKLTRRKTDDGEDGPGEVGIEIAGVPEEGRRPDPEDLPSFEFATVDLDSGKVSPPDTPSPDPDDLEECTTDGCSRDAIPEEFGLSALSKCGGCLGIPNRDLPERYRPEDDGDHE
jgi:hypothetical protein